MTKRVLYLEHCTDGTIGGSHFCLLEICHHIDRVQFEPVVCFFEANVLVGEFKKIGLEVLILQLPGRWSAPALLPRSFGRLLEFGVNIVLTLGVRTVRWMRVLRELKIDIVHINNACGYDHDLMLACRLSGRPCVVHQRGIESNLNRRTRYFANHVNCIIAISDAVSVNLLNQGINKKKIIRIDDGIDESRFAQQESDEAVRKRLGIAEDSPVIGIVGNIKHWKGQHVVVEAVGSLLRSFSKLRCLFVGSIVDRQYYNQLLMRAKEIGIQECALIFTGYEARPADLMRVMDVVIHASVEPEPFGIVLLEAMGAARPLIATNIGGPKEIVVSGKTGLLVPPGDVLALTMAVKQLLFNPEDARCMGELGRARYYERYTIQKTIAAIELQYQKLS